MTQGDFASLCDMLATKFNVVVGICGMPGSGKTTLSKRLAEKFSGRSLFINADDFIFLPTPVRKSYLESAIGAVDNERLRYLAQPSEAAENPYADPRSWYDWIGLANTLSSLRAGEAVERPGTWSQKTGLCDTTTRYNVPQPPEKALYFLDSIYLFEPSLADRIDYKVMIEMSDRMAVKRAAQRDIHRLDPVYQSYKDVVSSLHCRPYLDQNRDKMDFLLKPSME